MVVCYGAARAEGRRAAPGCLVSPTGQWHHPPYFLYYFSLASNSIEYILLVHLYRLHYASRVFN